MSPGHPTRFSTTETRSNDAYAFVKSDATTTSTSNGLNQLATVNGASASYDANGNLTFDPTSGINVWYQSQNDLQGGGGFGIGYDAFLRPIDTNVNGANWKQFVYDGDQIVLTEVPSAVVSERYVRGDNPDELLVWYNGSGSADRRFVATDERGSVVATTDSSGALIGINTYDEYGRPGASNIGRFQYTGQMWLPELGLYDYKARMYDPNGVGFVQTDPIGYADNANLYAYVGNDPVNSVDPMGLQECQTLYHNNFQYVDSNNNHRYDPGEHIIPGSETSVPFEVCTGGPSSVGGGSSARGSAGGEPKSKRQPQPKSQPKPCAYTNASGQCVYQRDKNGNLRFDPGYQKQVCAGYSRMMHSNNEVAAVSYGFSLFGFKFSVPAPANILNAIVGGVTTALSFAPTPPGC
jgi:RHS repeat-associated protein